MSGSAVGADALVTDPQRLTQHVSQHLGCVQGQQLLQCLRERPLEALLSVPLDTVPFGAVLGPCEDGLLINKEHLRSINGEFSSLSVERSVALTPKVRIC